MHPKDIQYIIPAYSTSLKNKVFKFSITAANDSLVVLTTVTVISDINLFAPAIVGITN